MAVRFFARRRQQAEQLAAAVAPVAPRPSATSRVLAPVLGVWLGVGRVFAALDHAFASLAIPFGAQVRDPRVRYAILLCLFAVISVVGALPIHGVPLVALAFGYVGVLAIGRAWVLNEKERTAIVKKLAHGDPDQLPDLRWTALVSALQLLILFPLLFQQVQWQYQLFKVDGPTNFGDWFWFAIDKTYLKALPDWSILYGIHISAIDFDAPWGRHLVLLSRLTFDYILIQGVLRLLAIRATIGEAVAAVKADPDMAVRLGRRAIAPLIEKLRDPDKAVRGAAANALTQLGDKTAIQRISEAVQD
ncbi:MAG: HEAT repeat domain-containing protein [Planctomycetes bacterium]|nr:HEAT repeat domain-containing protein [Planctomycetota bacterium]